MRWLVVFVLCASPAFAEPPPGADGKFHEWFQNQYSVAGANCCSVSDGHILEDEDWRSIGSGYEIRVNGKWYKVPPSATRDAVRGGENPTGHAVAWYGIRRDPLTGAPDNIFIHCFAPGFEG